MKPTPVPPPPYERPAGCGHWDGRAHCGAEDTRRYLIGPRCAEHAPGGPS